SGYILFYVLSASIQSEFPLIQRMTSFKANISIQHTVLLLLATLLASCYGDSGSDENNLDQRGIIPAVEAVQARYGSLPLSERLSGTVVAENQVALYPEITGQISRIHVQTGDYINEGEPIISLEDRQYSEQVEQARAESRINQARLKQAQARHNELEARYKRTKQLSDRNLSSDMEMETMQAQMASAEADIELAKAQLEQSQSNLQEQQNMLSKTVIRAPISGTLGQRNAEIGMQVGPNTPLFTIGDLTNLRVEIILTDEMLQDVQIGQTAQIYTGSGEDSEIIEAKLSRISPFLNNITRSTEGEIDVS